MNGAHKKYRGTLIRPVGRPSVPFYIVPEPAFTDVALSPEAWLVVAWLCGKPPGWAACVSESRRSLRFSDKVWARVKKELKAAGIVPLDHPLRVRGGIGGFAWMLDVDLKRFYK